MEGKLRAISGALVGMVAFAGFALALSPSVRLRHPERGAGSTALP